LAETGAEWLSYLFLPLFVLTAAKSPLAS
jgi:hypothetical protein